MNSKNLMILFVSVAILGGLFFVAGTGDDKSLTPQEIKLFEGFKVAEVAKIAIEKDDNQNLELELKDESWTIPTRASYPAEPQKIVSLMLRIFGVAVTQRITANPERFAALGLDGKLTSETQGKVTFFDKSGTELGGILVGKQRKTKPGGPPRGLRSGIYLRRTDRNEAYLYPEHIPISTSISDWINRDLITVLPAEVYSVTQYRGAKTDAAKKEFSLGNKDIFAEGSTPEFDLSPGARKGEELEQGKLTQVQSGLQTFVITDVYKAKAEEVADLKFDFASEYALRNGLVYTVQNAKKDAKYYAKIAVSYDAALVGKLSELEKAAQAKAKQDASASEVEAEGETETAKTAGATKEPDAAKKDEPKLPELKLSSAEEAKSLNEKFSSWVYVVPEYQATKFRHTRADLRKKEEEKAPA